MSKVCFAVTVVGHRTNKPSSEKWSSECTTFEWEANWWKLSNFYPLLHYLMLTFSFEISSACTKINPPRRRYKAAALASSRGWLVGKYLPRQLLRNTPVGIFLEAHWRMKRFHLQLFALSTLSFNVFIENFGFTVSTLFFFLKKCVSKF